MLAWAVERRQPHLLELEAKVSSARRYYTTLDAVGIDLDQTCLLGISRTVTWWFVLRNHQDPVRDGI
jgi:hypothetical protein